MAEYDAKYASRGVGGAGLGLGVAGTALGLLNGGLGNLLGTGSCNSGCGCSEDHWVNRYEAGKDAEIARLQSQIELRDANTYTMTEMAKLRDYVDRRIEGVNASISAQSVINAQVAANLSCMQGNIATLMGLTKTVIPITSVCPEPMPQYNSWTAPTAG